MKMITAKPYHIYLLLIGVLLFTVVACNNNNNKQPKDTAQQDTYYTCSMHPQIIEHGPGLCPICHMDLIQVHRNGNNAPGTLQLSREQEILANIQVDTVKEKNLGDETVLTGRLVTDEERISAISARISGRIDKLYFRNEGDFVQQGAPLYELYSEELNNAKQEYILALEKKEELGTATIDFTQLLESARHKLQLWGLSDKQINTLAKERKTSPLTTFYSPVSGYISTLATTEGSYIMEGGTLLRIADLSSIWAEAQLYAAQLPQVDLDGMAIVTVQGTTETVASGHIAFVNPELNTGTRLNLLRVKVNNTSGLLRPGTPVYVTLRQQPYKGISLPIDAVLRDSKGAAIWIKTAAGKYQHRMVKTGPETGRQITILSGLTAGEQVVTSGAYLLQSEYIFKHGSSAMTAHTH
ncbi:efflux RND transporter periplasmic adaptor subunit [Chitinophaga pendula]|uniref:efflux RND transporter periplasmic adaptor subunit n=1 Tax=Chitinophaga TaxID=79328 RepID=UPI0012FDE5DC|nr:MULTISPECIES: efflux RND transporter periplasmic adaptor subunit [Chitinophaga]UCJ09629.1 efflux RND transporter periplasmic adaptor subunit [Chitinophaga pendula]